MPDGIQGRASRPISGQRASLSSALLSTGTESEGTLFHSKGLKTLGQPRGPTDIDVSGRHGASTSDESPWCSPTGHFSEMDLGASISQCSDGGADLSERHLLSKLDSELPALPEPQLFHLPEPPQNNDERIPLALAAVRARRGSTNLSWAGPTLSGGPRKLVAWEKLPAIPWGKVCYIKKVHSALKHSFSLYREVFCLFWS